jgi:hypothetical protein
MTPFKEGAQTYLPAELPERAQTVESSCLFR